MMQSFGARLKYTEQYCMHTNLASQRVKGYHKYAHGNWQLSIHTLRVEKKPLALSSHNRRKLTSGLSKEGGGGDQD